MDIDSLRSRWSETFNERLPEDVISPDCDIQVEIERCQKVIVKLKAKLRREEFFLNWLKSQQDELENRHIPRTRSGDLYNGEKHDIAVAVAARKASKLKEMETAQTSSATDDEERLSHPHIYTSNSSEENDDFIYPAEVDITYHSDPVEELARELVQSAIHRAVALCEYVDTILMQAAQIVYEEVYRDVLSDTLRSPPPVTSCDARYDGYMSKSPSPAVMNEEERHEGNSDTLKSPPPLPLAPMAHEHFPHQHDSPIVSRIRKLSGSDSSGASTPLADEKERRDQQISLVRDQPLSLDDTTNTTIPIIDLNQTPTHPKSFSQLYSEDIGPPSSVVEPDRNLVQTNVIPASPSKGLESADEEDDKITDLKKSNGEVKSSTLTSLQHDRDSLSPEPSYTKLIITSKEGKKDDTLDGKVFGNFLMHQSDSMASLSSHSSHNKLIDPDSISLVINQCVEGDVSDDEGVLGVSMDSTSLLDEYLDTASLGSTINLQDSKDGLVYPASPVALRHNKESIVRRRNDFGRFDETSPVREEDKNGFAEFAELFEQTFQLQRSQREKSSSPHSNKVASVFVFEGSQDDTRSQFTAPVRRRGIRTSKSFQIRRNTVVEEGEVLIIRKLVVAGIVAAEKSYIESLNALKEYYRKPLVAVASTSQPILNEREVNTIFFIGIEELQQLHVEIYRMLEPRVQGWSPTVCVGDVFIELCKHLNLYKEYVEMYRRSLDCLKKCRNDNVSFEKFLEDVHKVLSKENPEMPQIQDLLRKPIDRLQSYSLVLNDLCQHTPDTHDDYQILKESLNVMSDFISSTHDPSSFRELSGGFNRELVKDDLMVELSDGIRKMRNLLLFHDILVCAKQKLSRNHVKLEYKWYLPLAEVQFHPYIGSENTTRQPVKVTSDTELSLLKSKMAEIKMQLKQEKAGSLQVDGGRKRLRNMRLSRLTKRLEEYQIALWTATPSLPLRLFGKNGKNYVFLVHTEDTRESWIMAIKKMQIKSNDITLTNLELQDLLSRQKLKHVDEISDFDSDMSNEVVEKEYLTGILRAHVICAQGVKGKPATYCCLEVDDYGKFDRKARTPVANVENDVTTWDQAYELEIHGAQQLKVYICFKTFRVKEETIARGSLSLPVGELKKGRKVKPTLKMYPHGTLQLVLQYFTSSSAASEPRAVMASSGVFRVPLSVVTEREKHDIPLVVQTCVDEVERRGMDETGIYRVAGVISDVEGLRKAFDSDYLQAQLLCAETDIHAVAGLLKKYFREMPDPLFTNILYPNFVDGLSLKDHEARDQCLITLLHSLPHPHFHTAVYIFEHLKKVAEHSFENKMTLGNLATVFGPNLIRPAAIHGDMTLESLDVMSQVGVLHYFLTLPSEMLDSSAWKRSSPGTLRKRIRNLSDQPTSGSPRPSEKASSLTTHVNKIQRSQSSSTPISELQSTV